MELGINVIEAKKYKGMVHLKGLSFMQQDLVSVLIELGIDTKLIDLYNHYSNSKEERINSLKEVIEQNKDYLICTTACISTIEFPESEYYCEEIDRVSEEDKKNKKPIPFKESIKRECEFLESLGFECINEWVGYEFQLAYLYTGNEIGKKIFGHIKSFIR